MRWRSRTAHDGPEYPLVVDGNLNLCAVHAFSAPRWDGQIAGTGSMAIRQGRQRTVKGGGRRRERERGAATKRQNIGGVCIANKQQSPAFGQPEGLQSKKGSPGSPNTVFDNIAGDRPKDIQSRSRKNNSSSACLEISLPEEPGIL